MIYSLEYLKSTFLSLNKNRLISFKVKIYIIYPYEINSTFSDADL